MGEVFLDAFLDTLKILPFLLVMNFLIEFIEYRSTGLKADKLLRGGAAPLLGTAVGVVPQCGFSVVATELYSKRKITLGALFAVYLATSDEALPIMLSSYEGLLKLWPVLVIKILFSLAVGYSVFGLEKLISRRSPAAQDEKSPQTGTERADDGELADAESNSDTDAARPSETECSDSFRAFQDICEHDGEGEHEHGETEEHCEHEHGETGDGHARLHGCHHHSLEESAPPAEDATKKQKAAWVWRVFIKHPLLHTLTVIVYIFIVNALFGIAVYYVGEDNIAAFISSKGYLQPVLAGLVGLIPNCAASVVITELYVVGGLNLGGAVAGLCVSAGIGYAILVKQNKPLKNSLLIIALMYVLSVALGLCVTACGF